MTAITTIFGLVPLALAGATVAGAYIDSLAVVVIGGLSTSTFLTLLCVPVLYSLLTRGDAPVGAGTQGWSGRSELGETSN